MSELYHQALEAAQTCDVSTPPDSLVLYSVSFLPTKENKEQALRFINNNPDKMMIDPVHEEKPAENENDKLNI